MDKMILSSAVSVVAVVGLGRRGMILGETYAKVVGDRNPIPSRRRGGIQSVAVQGVHGAEATSYMHLIRFPVSGILVYPLCVFSACPTCPCVRECGATGKQSATVSGHQML